MTDIPVWGYCCLAVADEAHGVHQAHVLPDGIRECCSVFLCRIVGEVYAAAVSIAKLLVLTAGIVNALYLTIEGGNAFQRLSRS